MSLITSLPEIEKLPNSVYVMHEHSEKYIPFHKHSKGQLSYVEGGLAYIEIVDKTYVIPARHYFWVPSGLPHVLTIGHSATVLRSIFFYAHDDDTHLFYQKMGIYPITDLLVQMIKYTENWDGHIFEGTDKFIFLKTIKSILPEVSKEHMPIVLPTTNDERVKRIIDYLANNLADNHSLQTTGKRFGISDRSLSRLFQTSLGISFLQYLKMLRMVKALELILQTNNSLSQISYLTGYQSLAAFSKAFFLFTNQRPSEFAVYR